MLQESVEAWQRSQSLIPFILNCPRCTSVWQVAHESGSRCEYFSILNVLASERWQLMQFSENWPSWGSAWQDLQSVDVEENWRIPDASIEWHWEQATAWCAPVKG